MLRHDSPCKKCNQAHEDDLIRFLKRTDFLSAENNTTLEKQCNR